MLAVSLSTFDPESTFPIAAPKRLRSRPRRTEADRARCRRYSRATPGMSEKIRLAQTRPILLPPCSGGGWQLPPRRASLHRTSSSPLFDFGNIGPPKQCHITVRTNVDVGRHRFTQPAPAFQVSNICQPPWPGGVFAARRVPTVPQSMAMKSTFIPRRLSRSAVTSPSALVIAMS
jgi:hypothetical protein